jgi:hypothetical protein
MVFLSLISVHVFDGGLEPFKIVSGKNYQAPDMSLDGGLEPFKIVSGKNYQAPDMNL